MFGQWMDSPFSEPRVPSSPSLAPFLRILPTFGWSGDPWSLLEGDPRNNLSKENRQII